MTCEYCETFFIGRPGRSVAHVIVVIALSVGGGCAALLAEIGAAPAGLGLAGGVVALVPLLQGPLALLLLLTFLLALPFTLLRDLLHRGPGDLRCLPGLELVQSCLLL